MKKGIFKINVAGIMMGVDTNGCKCQRDIADRVIKLINDNEDIPGTARIDDSDNIILSMIHPILVNFEFDEGKGGGL